MLLGQSDRIKEYTIALEVFDRPPDFDLSSDSTVRVEAHRLRKRLERYYEEEGKGNPIRVVLPLGHYVPQFMPHQPAEPEASEGESCVSHPSVSASTPIVSKHGGAGRRPWALGGLALAAAVVAGLLILAPKGADHAKPPQPLPAAGPEDAVRILAGYQKEQYVDRLGNRWRGDRNFTGGSAEAAGDYARSPSVKFLRAAQDLGIFQHFRAGDFRYDIPLKAGIYEMRLYFAETGFGPCLVAGGGENSRVFDIDLNGKPLVTGLDLFATAGECSTAVVLAFKDVQPAGDGQLHLKFRSVRDRPILNALELVPGTPGRMLPLRMIVGEQSYTDSQGRIWGPERYFVNGQVARHVGSIRNTPDADLYANERYGHFRYVIPVPPGRYTVTLHFSETFFGPSHPRKLKGPGSRVFHILCNGTALTKDFDIFQAAGGDFLPATLTFRGLAPSPQRSLNLSFVPVTDYASVRAIEVIDEAK